MTEQLTHTHKLHGMAYHHSFGWDVTIALSLECELDEEGSRETSG